MSENEQDTNTRADEWLTRLLRSSGRGPTASPEARQRIYGIVRERWEASLPAVETEPRPVARPWVTSRRLALAASLAAAAVVVFRLLPSTTEPQTSFAGVARTFGEVEVRRDDIVRPAGSGGLTSIRIGDEVTTGDGRIGLDLGRGELRLDAQSELAVVSAGVVELRAGRVYFDSQGSESTIGGSDRQVAVADPLRIDTRFGAVEHAGTQYEAGLVDAGLRIRVREGAVVFRGDGLELTAGAGEQVRIAANGESQRTSVAADDPEWRWVEDLAVLPPASEYRLTDVLRWISRETGHGLDFASPDVETRAQAVVLYDLQGLTPTDTLAALRGTTGFDLVDDGSNLTVTEARQ